MKDKERTKRKLIDAVAYVFRNEGYAGLSVYKVARLMYTCKIGVETRHYRCNFPFLVNKIKGGKLIT